MPLLAVIIGGLVGTGLRLGIDALLPHTDDGFPWSTLVINVIGAIALGALVDGCWRPLPMGARGSRVGLLGSFTTFSALAVSLVALVGCGGVGDRRRLLDHYEVAGAAATWAGIALSRRRGASLASPEADE